MSVGTASGGRAGGRAYSAALYLVLFVLGVLQGLVGSFQYGQSPAPLVAVALAVVIGVTCVFGDWGTRSFGGAMCPAAGWLLTSFLLSMGSHAGSVIITNSAAGQWYLYGGTLAVLLSLLVSFLAGTRRRLAPPKDGTSGPG
jgi:peptidoglycan/LPS O-acetylase OafA/YrhL